MDRKLELDLVARLKGGDAVAFDEVHAAYNLRLFNFLARLCRRRETAEDLVEELWLRVVTHARALQDGTRLAPWLFTIARNLHASYCRSRLLDMDAIADLHLWPTHPPEPSPFEAAAASEFQQRVEVALAALPGVYREALLLVALEGMTPAEAAVVCGVTGEAMRQRVRRARAQLARRLEVPVALADRRLREVCP